MKKNSLFKIAGLFPLLVLSVSCFAKTTPEPEISTISHTMDVLKGNVSVVDATLRGEMRWALWEDKIGETKFSHIALFSNEKNKSRKMWETSWPETYQPRIDVFRQWLWHGNQVVAVSLQLGAGYQQVKLYGLDANNKPVKIDEKEATASTWSSVTNENGDGTTVLVLYKASPVELKPECYGWDESSGKLVSKACK